VVLSAVELGAALSADWLKAVDVPVAALPAVSASDSRAVCAACPPSLSAEVAACCWEGVCCCVALDDDGAPLAEDSPAPAGGYGAVRPGGLVLAWEAGAAATLPPVRSEVVALLDRQAELLAHALSTAAAASAANSGMAASRFRAVDRVAVGLWSLIWLSPM
jgi:hypothetical protein